MSFITRGRRAFFLDHEDFKRSRKSLFGASFVLLLLNLFEINGENFELLGIVIKLNQKVTIALSSLLVIYFMYIFLCRTLEARLSDFFKKNSSRLQKYNQDHINAVKESAQYPEFNPNHEVDHLIELHALERRGKNIESKYEILQARVLMLFYFAVDVFPPFLLAMFSLIKADGFTAARSLIIG